MPLIKRNRFHGKRKPCVAGFRQVDSSKLPKLRKWPQNGSMATLEKYSEALKDFLRFYLARTNDTEKKTVLVEFRVSELQRFGLYPDETGWIEEVMKLLETDEVIKAGSFQFVDPDYYFGSKDEEHDLSPVFCRAIVFPREIFKKDGKKDLFFNDSLDKLFYGTAKVITLTNQRTRMLFRVLWGGSISNRSTKLQRENAALSFFQLADEAGYIQDRVEYRENKTRIEGNVRDTINRWNKSFRTKQAPISIDQVDDKGFVLLRPDN